MEALEATGASWITVHDSGETKTGTLAQIDFLFRDGWNQVGWDTKGQWILVYGEWNNVGILYYRDMPLAVKTLLSEDYLTGSVANYLSALGDSRGELSPNADGWARLLFE